MIAISSHFIFYKSLVHTFIEKEEWAFSVVKVWVTIQ